MTLASYTRKVSAEAGVWIARLHAPDFSPEDQTAFQLWLESDPAHAAAFEHATKIWEQLGSLPKEFRAPKRDTAIVTSRRALIAAAAGVAVLGSSVAFLRKAQAQDYQTEVGEQKRVPLADGSELFLDTNTALSVDMSGDRRSLSLRYGRVNCRIAHNDRPFRVTAGDRLVVGNRCEFDVLNSEGNFSVVVFDGNAEISDSIDRRVQLHSGDRTIATLSSPLRRDRPNLSLLTAWHTGHLVFKDETVSEAVLEVNRYSTLKLEIDDPEIASLHISGGYAVGDALGFAESLSQLLPIGVRLADGKVKLISRRDI
jgi:transmembrane sensor